MKKITLIPLLVMGLTACGGSSSTTSNTNPSATPALTTSKITGTVPGTRIDAIADNGRTYTVNSVNNGTAKHPFSLELPSGMGYRLVMVTNENTPDEVITPIGFKDAQGTVQTRLKFQAGQTIDLGNVPLAMGHNAAALTDTNHDGVIDSAMILDDVGAKNPLTQVDADKDGVNDFSDSDHGGYVYANGVIDPLDTNHNGVPNLFEDQDGDGIVNAKDTDINGDGILNANDTVTNTDTDHDGIPNIIDADSLTKVVIDSNNDGYMDDDLNRDGFHDSDINRDGYMEDDLNHDGFHDTDTNHDGYYDDDLNHNGEHDSNDRD